MVEKTLEDKLAGKKKNMADWMLHGFKFPLERDKRGPNEIGEYTSNRECRVHVKNIGHNERNCEKAYNFSQLCRQIIKECHVKYKTLSTSKKSAQK